MLMKKNGLLLALICSFLFTGCTTNNTVSEEEINQIINYYENGEYVQALEAKNNLTSAEQLDTYSEKIELMGNLQDLSNQDLGSYTCVLYFVGHYNDFEDNEIVDIAYPIVIKEAQSVANKDLDIAVQFERSMENAEISKKLEPMLSEDKEKMLQVMEKIANEIDYDLAEKEYENYLDEKREEYQADYNKDNPLQISNDSISKSNGYYYCKGTLKNVSNTSYTYVKIKVTYYDKNKNVLTTDWTYAVSSVELKGGENIQFEIMTKVDGTVDSYKCEIIK